MHFFDGSVIHHGPHSHRFDDGSFAWDESVLWEVLGSPDVVVQTKEGFCNLTEMVRHWKKCAELDHLLILRIRGVIDRHDAEMKSEHQDFQKMSCISGGAVEAMRRVIEEGVK